MPEPSRADRDQPGLRAAAGVLAGFALLAVVHAVAIALTLPLPAAGVGLRAAHHLFDAAETLGLGALAAALLGAVVAVSRRPRLAGALAYGAIALPIVHRALGDDLRHQASVALGSRHEDVVFVVYLAATSLALPAAHLAGGLLSRFPRLRLVAVGLSLAVLAVNYRFLTDGYFGVHGAVAWTALTFAGAALAPLAERPLRALLVPRRRGLGLVLAAALAAGLAVPPSNAARVELFRSSCAVAPWVLATVLWRAPAPRVAAPPSPWLADRAALPDVPPTSPRLLPPNPVVVLITVDALRADAIADPANDADFPTLAAMKREGAYFTRVSSPSARTAFSLTTLFSGRYFSELRYAMHGAAWSRFPYAADDPTVRFPQLLTDRGVSTSVFCSLTFLAGEFGVTRGFETERVVVAGRKHALGRQVIDPLMTRLARTGDEPVFLYTHLMEPHEPYDRGTIKTGPPHARYLSEVAAADAEIGRVARMLEKRFPTRGVLIVAADHGEAFGEHGTTEHSKTLYEEMIRIPLLVRGPGVVPRVVGQRVGLVDLGPTILDLFGAPTPASNEGQSLVPLLAGRDVVLDRPVMAEIQDRRAHYTPEGLKLIENPRRKTVEVYDLTRDPGETRDLFDEHREEAERGLAVLRAFYAAHGVR